MSQKLTPEDIKLIEAALPTMSPDEKRKTLELLKTYNTQLHQTAAKSSFLDFIHHVYPGYKVGAHHRHLARIFEEIAEGKKKRVIVNIAPRHGKSEMISYLAPAWYLGKYPQKKIIMSSHTADLAVNFGRRVRNLVGSDPYKDIFPDVELQADSKSASRWGTNFQGEYFAIGVGGALAGRGADLFIIDDPHALTLDTEVPTTSGFKTIADIQIGDKVFGPDGRPTRVIAKSEVWENREIYEVITDDGAVIECDGGHLWNYRSDTKLTAPHKNATTRQLAGWNKASKPCLPRHAPVQYPYKKLPVDPYVLGAWLGDGTTGLGRMTSHPDDMPFMRQQFEQAGYVTTTLTDSYSFGVKKLREHLHKLGIRDQKAIPAQYLLASVPQRMALLQGLMDTDGDVTEAGQCSFNSTNRQLAEQFRTLIHSLGVKAKLHRYEDKRPGCSPVYRVTFKLKDCCRLPRKNARTYTPTDKRCRSIEVRKTNKKAAVQCITVDRTDGLFLVGREYVVTHNSEQEAKQGKPEVFLPAWEWFQSGPIQRLMPGGAIIIVMCMTGDTRVLMEDGTEKRLDQIKTGDYVATYDDGVLATAKVLNHQSNGVDSVYTIYTQSGRILQANERHPFLVEAKGERKWKRLSELKTGDMLVVLKDAEDRQDRSVSPDCAPHVKQRKVTTKNIQTPHIIPQGITGNGKINFVRGVIAKNLRKSKDTVKGITTPFCIGSNKRPENHILHRIGEISGSKVGTALHRLTLTIFYSSKAAFVRCVSSLLPRVIPAPIGTANYASTTITSLEKSEDCFATTVIWQSDMQNQKQQHLQWQNITDFTVDEIVAITPSGKAEVFDIQIERTENFIANGAVSHNTRWSKLDLTGQIINQMTRIDGGEDWEIVEFPAIIEKNGEEVPLWPEFWALEELKKKRDVLDIRYWNAQYMQQPTSEEGALIKREWWQMWDKEQPPDCEFIIMSLDAAQETNNRSDYNALTVWGVFFNEETDNYNIILLNSIKERLEFPDLKRRVLEEYKEWEPDAFIVEKKSNGAALYQELRRMGVPVGEFTPGKGNDKISRVNAVSDLFRSGIVWAPERRWAKEVIEECNDFPSGTNDDLVDSTTQALMRFRQGGFIRLPTDEQDELPEFKSSRQQRYYSL